MNWLDNTPWDQAGDLWTPIAEVELETGRILDVKRMLISMTFEGYLMVSRDLESNTIRNETRQWVSKSFWGCDATVIVDDGKPGLPNYRILAYMESMTPVDSNNPGMDYSYLMACWFTDNVASPPEEMVKSVFQKIKWEDYARDGSWGDL